MSKVIAPVNPPTEDDWRDFEQRFGLHFPNDFKYLHNNLGDGWFGLCLVLYGPTLSAFYNYNTSRWEKVKEWVSDDLKEVITLYPEENGLFYIGKKERTFVFLKPDGKDLKTLVCIDSDLDFVFDSGVGVAEFIYKLYKEEYLIEELKSLRIGAWRRYNDSDEPFFTQEVLSRES
jgi:hypothetical protein